MQQLGAKCVVEEHVCLFQFEIYSLKQVGENGTLYHDNDYWRIFTSVDLRSISSDPTQLYVVIV